MIMRVSIVAGALALAALQAVAADDPPGARRTVDFSVKWVTQGASAINHTFKGACELIVGTAQDRDLDGKGENASRRQTNVELSEEMKKCRGNVQCVQGVAAKIQNSGVANVDQNYIIWGPLSCSGLVLSADDKEVEHGTDDGEGGPRAYTSTTTTKGSTAVTNCANCIRVQYDLKKKITEYRFGQPIPPAAFVQSTSGTESSGAPRNVMVRAFPDGIAQPTLIGPPQAGKVIRTIPGGTVTFEWTIKR